MVMCLEKPRLQLIPEAKTEERMEVVPFGDSDVGLFAEENQAKFEQLERDRNRIGASTLAVGVANITGFAIFSPSALIGFPFLWKSAAQVEAVSLQFFLMSELMAAFDDEDVAIEVRLTAEGLRTIDFFLRFPDKEYVLLQVRSRGKCRVFFNSNRQALQYRREGGGLKFWKPDPIAELIEQERWIRRQRPDLLGTSSRDKRRQMAKAIVLWNDSTLGDHPEDLYVTMDDQKYLMVKTAGSAFVVTKDQVIDFIRAYLNFRRSQKTS